MNQTPTPKGHMMWKRRQTHENSHQETEVRARTEYGQDVGELRGVFLDLQVELDTSSELPKKLVTES